MYLRKLFLCFFISTVCVLMSPAQNTNGTVALKRILLSIEKQHQVIFSYLEDEIAPFKLNPPDDDWTLLKKLDYITKKTSLQFNFISDSYISIYDVAKKDKMYCGYLKDSQTGIAVEKATLFIKERNQTFFSDEKGYFELKLNPSESLLVSHVNYENQVLTSANLTNCPEIRLLQKSYPLEEVVTPVYLTKGIAKQIDGTFEIKPKKFGLLPGLTEPDVLQTMQQLPGISSVDETISNITIRGGTHDQNLVLWNGIRLFQTGHFFGLISVFNPNLAQKITISKNGSSAFFSESVSGIVDISTQNEITKTSGSVGSNLINADFNAAVKLSDKSSFEISGRRSFTDLFISPTYKSYTNRVFQNTVVTGVISNQNVIYETDENFYFYDTTLKYNHKISNKTSASLNLLWIANNLDVGQTRTENNFTRERQSHLTQNTQAGSLDITTKWSASDESNLVVYGSFYEICSENQSIEGNQIFNQENAILDTGLHFKHTKKIHDHLTLYGGYQFNEIGIQNQDIVNSPFFSRTIKEVLHNHALIAGINYNSKNQKFTTDLGIRQNYISQLGTFITEPRIRFSFAPNSTWRFDVLGEAKNQTTSQVIDLQQDFLGLEKRRWILANGNDIPITKSKQISAGIHFFKKRWLLSVDNFYKKVDGITSKSQGFQNQLEFLNLTGGYTALGTEFLVQKQLRNMNIWVTYTYTKNEYSFATFSPEKFPNNFENRHQINCGTVYEWNHLRLALGGHWYTGKPITLPVSGTVVNGTVLYESPNSARLRDYLQLNFSAGYTVKMHEVQNLQFGVSIQNITNRENIINSFYRVNQNTGALERVNTYSLEITPNAFIRWKF